MVDFNQYNKETFFSLKVEMPKYLNAKSFHPTTPKRLLKRAQS